MFPAIGRLWLIPTAFFFLKPWCWQLTVCLIPEARRNLYKIELFRKKRKRGFAQALFIFSGDFVDKRLLKAQRALSQYAESGPVTKAVEVSRQHIALF